VVWLWFQWWRGCRYCKEGRGGNTKLIAAADRETGTCQKDTENSKTHKKADRIE